MEIRHYLDPNGRDLYQEWVDALKDPQGRKAVVRRVLRIELGTFGDHTFVRDGVSELRVDAGPGYRVYYGLDGETIVLLLCGGNKSSQRRDIDRAIKCWRDYQRRMT